MNQVSDPRHNARKIALSTLFSWIFNEPNIQDCIDISKELLEENDFDNQLALSIIQAVQQNVFDIDKIIEVNAPEWPIDKISKIDLIILRMAIAEMAFGVNTPKKVAIDEAIELAKLFGNETSSKFVNGVLGSIAEKIQPNQKEIEKVQTLI